MNSSAEIRRHLGHPVIDIDGHMVEHLPTLAPYIEQEGLSLDHPALQRLLPPAGGTDRSWHDQTPDERAATRTPRGPWWGSPARQTIDLATALFPPLLYETVGRTRIRLRCRLPEHRPRLPPHPRRTPTGGACAGLSTGPTPTTFAPLADRLTPVAAIPMHTPEEAIAELDHAVTELGFKAVVCAGYVQRPFAALADKDPEVSNYAFWLDQFGIDSAYDYDPVWRRAQELGVSVAFHSGFIGMTPYRSISNYVFNHISMLAEGQQSLAKSLFLGGVTRRFPRMKFGFLEGGVAWAASLYCDIIGHWEKRNLGALRRHLDPALIDRELMGQMIERYAPDAPRVRGGLSQRPPEPEEMLDEWAACGIEKAQDIKTLFADRFFFGCEADDPLTSLAFNTKVNPFGTELNAMMGSDIAHWDVPDMAEVLEEAWEMVEHQWIDEAAFEKFTFTNPVRFYTDTNPDSSPARRWRRRSTASWPGPDMLDLLLQGGTVIDGTGAAARDGRRRYP